MQQQLATAIGDNNRQVPCAIIAHFFVVVVVSESDLDVCQLGQSTRQPAESVSLEIHQCIHLNRLQCTHTHTQTDIIIWLLKILVHLMSGIC